MSLGPNGGNRVCLLLKLKTRLRGTNFCTSSSHFALSFVRQLLSKCIQIVQNTPKHEFRVQWSGSGAFVAKNSNATSWHKLLHCSARFAPSFVRQPNGSKCTQMVQNSPKHEFRQWGGSSAFVVKNSNTTSWHELLHHFGPFCTEFCKATKRSQMQPNSTKRNKTSV